MGVIFNSILLPFGRPLKYAIAKSLWYEFLIYLEWAEKNIEIFSSTAGKEDIKLQNYK